MEKHPFTSASGSMLRKLNNLSKIRWISGRIFVMIPFNKPCQMPFRIAFPLLVSLLFLYPSRTFSQTYETNMMAGLSATFLDYQGLMSGNLAQIRSFDPGISVGAHMYINPLLNFSLNSAFIPETAYPMTESQTLTTSLIDVNALIRLKSNGTFLREDALFAPYLVGGFGMNTASNNIRLYVPAGLGLSIQVSRNLSLQFESLYKQRLGAGKYQHISHSAGFAFALSQRKPRKPEVKPETQKDTKPAVASNSDRDADGVIDRDDICPDEKGLALYLGCPEDANAKKTTSPAVATTPPTVKPGEEGKQGASGPAITNVEEIPIHPENTTRPESSQSTENSKIRPISEADLAYLNKAMENILFEAGSDQLTSGSLPILDKVAEILDRNPQYSLQVLGHTDNTGPHKDNVVLSIRRAFRVKYYLVYEKGVRLSRITSDGYSSAVPVSDNATDEGRRLNRRVELRLSPTDGSQMPPALRGN